MPRGDPEPRTVDSLRVDIDRGLTGDKVAGSDPAAAPLGTDDEAAGTPPTRAEIDLEARSRTLRPEAAVPGPGRGAGRARLGVGLTVAGVVVLILVALAITMAG